MKYFLLRTGGKAHESTTHLKSAATVPFLMLNLAPRFNGKIR